MIDEPLFRPAPSEFAEDKKPAASRWGDKAKGVKRRNLTEYQANRAGYPGALREPNGWYRGARVSKRPERGAS